MSLRRKDTLPLRRVRSVADARGKVTETTEGNGWLEGYLAVFGNVDRTGERFLPGAFAKTVAERVASGRVPLMAKHICYGGDVVDVVGIISQAKEDDYGLWIHADFDDDAFSQAIRSKCTKGLAWGLSVGYELIRWAESQIDGGKYVLDLMEAKLLEGTITVSPANELAVITAAKSLKEDARSLPVIGQDTERLALFEGKVDRLLALLQEDGESNVIVPNVQASTDGATDILRAKSFLLSMDLDLELLEL